MGFPYQFPFYFHAVPTWSRPWRLELHDADGRLIRILTDTAGAGVSARLNEPSALSFSIAASDEGFSSIQAKNQVWLRDRDGSVAGKYVIEVVKDRRGGEGTWRSVEALDFLSKLGREHVFAYHATASQPVSTTVADLLALQINANPITLGSIASAVGSQTLAFDWDRISILQALRYIEESLDCTSFFYVDTNGAFQWVTSLGSDTGQQLRVEKNARWIEREQDGSQVATRVYYYGAPSGTDRVKISDHPSYSNDYVQDTWAEWTHRKQFVVDHSQVEMDGPAGKAGVANFPVYIHLAADASLAANAAADAADLRFATSSGANLSWELDAYDSGTGELEAWVQVSLLSGIKDSVFYLYYGNSGAAANDGTVDHNPSGKSAAWVATYNANQADPAGFVAAGDGLSTPGLLSRIFFDERITHPTTLVNKAVRTLETLGSPVVSYGVDLVDLASTGTDFDFEGISLGSRVQVIDLALGVDATERVASLDRDLDAPHQVRMQLAHTRRTLIDELVDLQEEADADNVTDPIDEIDADHVRIDEDTTLADLLYPGTDQIMADAVALDADTSLADDLYTGTTDIDADKVRLGDATTLADMKHGDVDLIDADKVSLDGPSGDLSVVGDWEYRPVEGASGLIDPEKIFGYPFTDSGDDGGMPVWGFGWLNPN